LGEKRAIYLKLSKKQYKHGLTNKNRCILKKCKNNIHPFSKGYPRLIPSFNIR
jgi:hypothetical protein